MRTLIRGAQYERELKKTGHSLETIFDGILHSDLPSSELSVERLKDEAVSIIGAGIASAEWTSTLACFHIISDPKILRRLKLELTAAIPDPQNSVSLTEMEKLPYLMACVEESRSNTFSSRLHAHLFPRYPSCLRTNGPIPTDFTGHPHKIWLVDYSGGNDGEHGHLAHAPQ